MAEELYFLKLDAHKTKNILVDRLRYKEKDAYEKYLNNSSFGDYETIVSKLETDIQLLSQDEFWSLFFWFYEKHEQSKPTLSYNKLEKVVYQDMLSCGLELFCEIPSKTPVRKFHEIMGDYAYASDQDFGFKCTQKQFTDFLNYFICYTGELKLFLNEYYYTNSDYSVEDWQIKILIEDINIASGDSFHLLALDRLQSEMEFNLETIELSKKLRKFRKAAMKKSAAVTYPKELVKIDNRESDLINRASVLHYGTHMKEALANYQGIILRLHSY